MKNRTVTYAAVLASACSCVGFVVGALVLLDIVPMQYVWGGRVTDRSQLVSMEAITFAVNALIIWVIGMRAGYFKPRLKAEILKVMMVVLGVIMLLNTLGNFAAKTDIEKFFAIPTAISAVCFWILYRD